eukprot:TRINITY_DN1410_c0_g1_i1.p1 TRINITY_DN1410_c0_g1~~TRINITY_DN1410_c0_g1_i1.p1  ORF type:complete len:193 (-),score=45.38 TRINITY_DN1410_c0_g1_i1:318-896(-)
MSARRILYVGNPIFHQAMKRCAKSFIPSAEAKSLVQDMIATMESYKGLGLTASQIGVNKKLFVAGHKDSPGLWPPKAFFNPSIKQVSPETFVHWENCLSIPKLHFLVPRPKKSVFEFTDEQGVKWEATATGLASAIVHHELQHIIGMNLFHSEVHDIVADEEIGKVEQVEEVEPGQVEYRLVDNNSDKPPAN